MSAGTGLAVLGALHSAVNALLLRRPLAEPPPTTRTIGVVVPARNEEGTIAELIGDLRRQRGVARMTVFIADDESSDDTERAANEAAGEDLGIFVELSEQPRPPGWYGKAFVCHQAAIRLAPQCDVLVFVDADVRLQPRAVAAAVDLLDRTGLDLVSPWPRAGATGWRERMIRPLQQWAWLSALPLRAVEHARHPLLVAAGGRFLAVTSRAYLRSGGHAAVAEDMLENLALLRAVKRSGGTGGPADGTGLAEIAGHPTGSGFGESYRKALWSAFGSPAGALAALGALNTVAVLPAAALALGPGRRLRGIGLLGYAGGVLSRAIAASTVGYRCWPDAALHPLSALLFSRMTVQSLLERRKGALRWKDRPVTRPGRSRQRG